MTPHHRKLVDSRRPDAGILEPRNRLCRGELHKCRLDNTFQHLAIFNTTGIAPKSRIVGKVISLQHDFCKGRPFAIVLQAEENRAI